MVFSKIIYSAQVGKTFWLELHTTSYLAGQCTSGQGTYYVVLFRPGLSKAIFLGGIPYQPPRKAGGKKEKLKRPEGPTAESQGPEGPLTSFTLYFLPF